MRKIDEIILRPLITERGTELKEKGKYLFLVAPDATKNEIGEAVEIMFKKDKIEVVKVNTARLPGKKRRFGRFLSEPGRYKKAVVTLKVGQKIEFFEGA
jgi:large subunit ribosomal protein L23